MALMRTVEQLAEGDTAEFAVASASDLELVRRWCEKTGNTLVSTLMVEQDSGHVTVGRGRPRNPASMIPADRMPGARLWLYTNFHCNLACDYCCVASSPKTDPRLLGIDAIQTLVAEAAAWGVRELYLTGGEPFLLPNIDMIVRACADRLPTTLLTNGMLFRGQGLRKLRAMPREGLTLQISVDSPTADVHDSHRGAGSWKRALDGIRVALAEGFIVRVAATISAHDDPALDELHALFDGLGIPRADQVIRPIAHQGVAEEGVAFSSKSLIPEVTVTAEGVYWHPVAALDEDALVSRQILPLAPSLDRVSELFIQQWSSVTAATSMFACA
ncbi:radical SAM protein [Arthrobacter sp. H14-L1]|uniref:Rv1681 family radical SAM protein n=1 Tax=Arthrobacter sp. H14-L1 TaxID=2996697 RepID=UPI00226E364E|nr:radical SAM protein [Arthrobacter sp. H14-L1]MCY0905943.1 radical SAM protein [Arthrobacter sp. H14-L1]